MVTFLKYCCEFITPTIEQVPYNCQVPCHSHPSGNPGLSYPSKLVETKNREKYEGTLIWFNPEHLNMRLRDATITDSQGMVKKVMDVFLRGTSINGVKMMDNVIEHWKRSSQSMV